MVDVISLKKQRGGLKSRLTYYKNSIQNPNIVHSEASLQSILHRLRLIYDKLDICQTDLEHSDPDTNHEEDRNQIEDEYTIIEASILSMLSEFQIRHNSSGTTALQTSSSVKDTSETNVKIRLPQIELPKFNGSILSWSSFKSCYEGLIHENNTLSDLSKFQYLHSCLREGTAFQFVEVLPITGENYLLAWKTLLDRYDNQHQIRKAYIKEIYEIKRPQENSSSSLQTFIDTFWKNSNALKTLNVNVVEWEPFLLYHLAERLDTASRIEVEKKAAIDKSQSLDEFMAVLLERCRILETISPKPVSRNKSVHQVAFKTNQQYEVKPNRSFVASMPESASASSSKTSSSVCPVCNGAHSVFKCQMFEQMSLQDRQSHIRKLQLCSNCFHKSHSSESCKFGKCRYCHRRHHTLLHSDDSPMASNQKEINQSQINQPSTSGDKPNHYASSVAHTSSVVLHDHHVKSSQVLLATAVLWVYDHHGNRTQCRALLDTGSQSNFITERLCQNLRLRKSSTSVPVTGINRSLTQIKYKVDLTISSRVSDFKTDVGFFVLPTITDELPLHRIDIDRLNLPQHIQLADPGFFKPQQIDMLLGAELYCEMVTGNRITICEDFPPMQESVFGYLLCGPIRQPNTTSSLSFVCTLNEISAQIQKFWQLEEVSSPNNFSLEEKACEDHYIRNVKRDPSGRYSVALPTTSTLSSLGESSKSALHQFIQLERRLLNRPELHQQYTQFMTEYRDLNHMSVVESPDVSTYPQYYMPHHSVIKEDSLTTKLRVVFNASSKTSSGLSLNDAIMVGPTIQYDLFTTVVRFRRHVVAFTADIAKMYRQINIHTADRDLQRIWWRDLPEDPIKAYRLNTVTYGTSSAPYLAVRTLHQLAQDEQLAFPEASKVLMKDFYVDDVMSGAPTLAEAQSLQSELVALLARGGFELRKWASNRKLLLLDKLNQESEQVCALGLSWHPDEDYFQVIVGKNFSNKDPTKRIVISEIAQLFDPLGLCAPVVFCAKTIMQQLWSTPSLSWDDPLPPNLAHLWNEFRDQYPSLSQIQISRCILPATKTTSIELHGFGDASEKGYGCSIYIRSTDTDNHVQVRLLCAKSRVAPLRHQTIPRLELCAALLLAQLAHKIRSVIDISFDRVVYWSDSEITIFRIHSAPSRFCTFVANRISQIQELSCPEEWKFVPTEFNPADVVSRGLLPSELEASTLWWNGPHFLLEPECDWPQQHHITCDPHLLEYRKTEITLATIDSFSTSILDNCSDFCEMVRLAAICRRFIRYEKNSIIQHYNGPLTADEIQCATNGMIKAIQHQHFSNDLQLLNSNQALTSKSNIKRLNPFIDKDGLLKVGGRLENSQLPYNQQHPILLPRNHDFCKLLVRHEHFKNLHAGPQALLSFSRQKFWIIGGRSLCNQVVHNCLRCARTRPKSIQQLMGQLPPHRVTPSRPFTNTGVDFCGPFNVTFRIRTKTTSKVYIAIFVCFSTKATHLELVTDLTTDAFLAALRRFIARRGRCSVIYSDNATNFIGARNELKELQQLFTSAYHQHEVLRMCGEEGIEWRTIPPRSPHFGGLWESAVKSAKHHLKRTVGNSLYTSEELNTIIIQIESCLNSRPITPMSDDPSDLKALTPGHFLIGGPLNSIPEPSLLDVNGNRLSRYQKMQQQVQTIWRRWSNEYLVELQNRNKWQSTSPNVHIGQFVVIKDDNLPPLKWLMGRIISTQPGTDGIVRVVTIRTAHGEFKRAISRICILPIDTTDSL